MTINTNEELKSVEIDVPLEEQSTESFESSVLALYRTYHKQGYSETIKLRGSKAINRETTKIGQPLPRMRTRMEAIKLIQENDAGSALTASALRRIMMKGEIPYIDIGSKRLINVDALIGYLNEGNHKTNN